MKKKLLGLVVVLATIGMFAGCGAAEEEQPLNEMEVESYVTLGNYTGMEVSMSTAEVEEQVQTYLQYMSYYGMLTAEDEEKITDREVVNGDMVNIDYAGYKDEVAFDGGTAQDQFLLIGSGSFIDGFEEGLEGVKPGETVDLNLTFPESYQSEELAGQDVVFTVTVNYIYDSTEIYDYYYETLLEDYVLETFMTQCIFTELPDSLVEEYRTNLENSITAEATAYEMDADTLCYYYYGMDLATFLDTYAPESAKQSIAFQAVANEQNLNLTEEELDAEISAAALANGYTDVDEFMGSNTREDYREYFTYVVAMEYLVDNAVVIAE